MKEYLKSLIGLMFGAIALTLPAAASAQSGIGGGGTGGNPGITINRVRTGVDTWTYPTQINGVWSQKTLTYDYATGILSVTGEQPIQSIPPLCNVHWDYAPAAVNHGSISLSGTFEYTVQLPAGQNVKSIWVKVTSKSNVSFWAHSSTIGTDNGLGDDEEGNDTWRKMEGAHLRKVSIDDQGTGHFSVSVNAHGTVDGATHVQMGGSVTGTLEPDPRTIGLRTNYAMKEINSWITKSAQYMTLSSEERSYTYLGENKVSSIYGKFPTKNLSSISVQYKDAIRVPSPQYSTDALALTMYAYVALEPQVFVFDGATPIPSDHITKAFWSDYGGAFATPITGFATYDSSSNTSFDLGGSTGAIPADQMTVENSVLAPVIKVEKRVHPVTVSSVNGATFGTYKSKFVFHDGVVGKTEVRINYMNSSYPIQSTEGPQGCFSPQSDATQVFETLTGFIGEPSSSVELQKSLQNIFTSINFGLGVLIAFNWETIGLVLVLSLVETYVGSLLDSNGLDWGSKSETFNKPTAGQGYAEYWDVVNYAEVDLTMIASLTPCTYKELTNRCQWSQAIAPFQKVVMQARENWDENGFVKRGAAPWFSSATYAENPSNTAKWCHYRYVGAPGPNPG